MDNQFYPPNGGYPQGQPGMQPMGQQPVQQADPNNPYLAYMQQGQAYPQQGDAYQQQGYDPYMQQTGHVQPQQEQPYQQPMGMNQPDASNPYLNYGGAQQPYAEAGYQYHFDHTQSVMQEQPMGFPVQELKPQKPKLRLTVFHVAVIVAALGTPAIAVTSNTYVSESPQSLASKQKMTGNASRRIAEWM